MRIVIFGTGLMARLRARHLLMDGRVSWVGLASSNPIRAKETATEIGASFYGGLEEALVQNVDALVVAGASDDHAGHIRLGLAAGVPIFSEKPLATDLEECREVVRDAEAASVEVQVGFQRRFDKEYVDAKNLLDSGQLGRLYGLRLISHDHQPPTERFVTTSGGLFRDLGVHDYDLARWLTGEEVCEVFVVGAARSEWDYFERHDDVDTAVTLLKMESGLPVVISSARHSPDGHDVRAELYGSRHNVVVGYGSYAPLRSPGEIAAGKKVDAFPNFLARFEGAFEQQSEAFVDWVAGETPNPCPAKHGVEALRVAVAAELSWKQNRPVVVSEI